MKDEAQYTEKEAETVEDSKEEKENAEKSLPRSLRNRKEGGDLDGTSRCHQRG